jgi:carbamoyl-phosphate synthase small subunit
MKGLLSFKELSNAEKEILFQKTHKKNLINEVSLKSSIHFPGDGKRIVMMDFGYKKNILRSLLRRKCDVVVVPWNTSFEEISQFKPQGILLSNGPGDPTSVPEVLPVIKKLQEHYPLFGICMGHQLFALANGAQTMKLKFGHRGANHPVKDLKLNKVFMTSQNHGYSVTKESIQSTLLQISQININDESIEGLIHKNLPAFSVQYHPEACPGPEDTNWLFDHFLNLIRS